jgi:hypothetical protein
VFDVNTYQGRTQPIGRRLFPGLIAMATEHHAQMVENIIGYTFRSKRDLLFQALTAAGAVEAEWDGNRKLAQLGTAMTEFLFVYLGYEVQADRSKDCNKSYDKHE